LCGVVNAVVSGRHAVVLLTVYVPLPSGDGVMGGTATTFVVTLWTEYTLQHLSFGDWEPLAFGP